MVLLGEKILSLFIYFARTFVCLDLLARESGVIVGSFDFVGVITVGVTIVYHFVLGQAFLEVLSYVPYSLP